VAFADANVGVGKTVNYTNIAISGGTDQLNYTLAATVGTVTADISARTLTLSSFTANNKDYDGTTNVTGDGFADDRITGDDLTFTWDVAFTDANVGIGKTVNYTNITISGGTDQLNYTLAATTGTATADITPLTINVTATENQSKTYGDADPELTYGFTPALIGDDTFTGVLARAAGEVVGTYAIIQGTLALSTNYVLSFTGANFEITPAPLTITANTITKTVGVEYVFSGTEFTTQGLVNNGLDEVTSVTLSSAGAAASAAIGNYPITITPLSETGVGLDNYNIGYIDGNMEVVDKITLVLTGIIAESKVYDGTTDVIISNYGTLTGVVDGDDVSIDELLVTASFDNKNAGTGKTVTLSNIQLIGADAEKYTISDQTAQANITARTLTLSNFTLQ
jgi:hypothetical protein